MKKIVSALIFGAVLVSAATIDESSSKMDIVAYKTSKKVAVPATFKDVKFAFSKGEDIATQLKGATAIVNEDKIDTNKNPARDKNIINLFFKHFNSKVINATITDVRGDDNAGELDLLVKMNGVEKSSVMKYETKDGVLKATGMINIDDFAAEALAKFTATPVIKALHEGKTWPEVTINFSANVK